MRRWYSSLRFSQCLLRFAGDTTGDVGKGSLAMSETHDIHTDPRSKTKSTATLAAEARRDHTLYTLQEYIDREEEETLTRKRKLVMLEDASDNPIWLMYSLALLAAATLFVIVCVRIRQERFRFDPHMRAVQTFDMPGGPAIGGPFELTGTDGKTYTQESFKGKWLLIYFGFVNCPDICPDEMAKLSRLINQLDKKVGKDYWQPLFISVDAKRDTPELVEEYLSDFHPRIFGLTGTAEQVETAAKAFRVFFAVPDGSEPDDYLVDHSIIMYLMYPDGSFCDYTTKEFTWLEVYNKCLRRMIDYERAKEENVNVDVANLASFSELNDIKPA